VYQCNRFFGNIALRFSRTASISAEMDFGFVGNDFINKHIMKTDIIQRRH
jgi:hypothetical protein